MVFFKICVLWFSYDKYNNVTRKNNPETGEFWSKPEVGMNIATELEDGPALKDERVDALVAFLKTLTDQRYESQLNE